MQHYVYMCDKLLHSVVQVYIKNNVQGREDIQGSAQFKFNCEYLTLEIFKAFDDIGLLAHVDHPYKVCKCLLIIFIC